MDEVSITYTAALPAPPQYFITSSCIVFYRVVWRAKTHIENSIYHGAIGKRKSSFLRRIFYTLRNFEHFLKICFTLGKSNSFIGIRMKSHRSRFGRSRTTR